MNVLICIANLKIGGAQRVAASISEYAPSNYHFFYQVFDPVPGDYEASIVAKGHRIIRTVSPQNNLLGYLKSTASVIRREQIDVVHSHNMYSSGFLMLLARILGVKGRISHSHTAKDEALPSFLREAYVGIMRHWIRRFSTDYLACGTDAGRELYGQRFFDKKGVIVKNGIDISLYQYHPGYAEEIRKKYGLEGKFVIGHVGHYAAVKNQSYLLKLLPDVLRKRPNATMIFFGEGDQREALEKQIRDHHLEDYAVLAGNSNEIHKVLSAFDVFAFPSLFEGTPLALIEAQANSLPCIVSTNVPKDAVLTDLVTQIPLDDPAAWIREILCASRDPEASGFRQLSSSYETIEQSMRFICGIYKKYERATS